MHERFPHFSQSGNRDTGMSQAYMTESRETTKETMQNNTFQKTTNKSRQNPKKCLHIPQEGVRETGKRKWGNKQKTSDKMAGSSSDDSVLKNPPAVRETLKSLGREDPLEKEMAAHPSVLAQESLGQRSLVDYSPWGRTRLSGTQALAYQ